MGRKNKAKKTNRSTGRAVAAVAVTIGDDNNGSSNDNASYDELSFLYEENRQQFVNGSSYNEPTLFPKKPNMFSDPVGMRNKLHNLSEKRSATATRLIEANQMLNEIEKFKKNVEIIMMIIMWISHY